MKVDIDLLCKYNKPGPRYTSYPTAPQFSGAFGPAEYREEIAGTNGGGDMPNLSLYFHLPFCETLCYFCACNMIITHKPDRIAAYLDDLKKEIDLIRGLVHPDRRVTQLHWGGGSPSYLSPVQIQDLLGFIRDRFDFAQDAEVGIEVDPRRLTPEHLPAIRSAGFNRVSFGMQDLNPEVQRAVNRIQPEALNRRVVEESRALGFDSVNIDLIYGLPYQTRASYAETLEKVIEISPDRLAVFNYAHVPWLKRHQGVIPSDVLPSTTDRLEILKLAIERLTEAGYVYIGMDHFARADDDLAVALKRRALHRNFQGYTTHGDAEIYAMGVTSISQLANAYAQNLKTEREYAARLARGEVPTAVGYRLDADDQVRRHVITELMCNNRVTKADVESRFGVRFDAYFESSLARMDEFVRDGLVSISNEAVDVSEAGRLVIRNIVMVFDRYLADGSGEEQPRYSRTV